MSLFISYRSTPINTTDFRKKFLKNGESSHLYCTGYNLHKNFNPKSSGKSYNPSRATKPK